MGRRGRSLCLGLLLVVGLLLAAVPAQAGHDTDPHTKNLRGPWVTPTTTGP